MQGVEHSTPTPANQKGWPPKPAQEQTQTAESANTEAPPASPTQSHSPQQNTKHKTRKGHQTQPAATKPNQRSYVSSPTHYTPKPNKQPPTRDKGDRTTTPARHKGVQWGSNLRPPPPHHQRTQTQKESTQKLGQVPEQPCTASAPGHPLSCHLAQNTDKCFRKLKHTHKWWLTLVVPPLVKNRP